jgi:SAM-dependent methyltransferase
MGSVIGCDPDPVMLRVAKKALLRKGESYALGQAEHLPFTPNAFDAVTAFSAFHWFNNPRAIKEIKRVLRPGGLIFVVNKAGTRNWGEGYRGAIVKATGYKVAPFKNGTSYIPENDLRRSGFLRVRKKIWKKAEYYTLPGAIEYVQSTSIWNSVSLPLRAKALKGLRLYFEKIKKTKGKIGRVVEVKVVVGMKPII